METVAIITIASVVSISIGGLLIRSYFPAYIAEKGKNLASKEDLAQLTDLVENVKALHTSQIERLKADLLAESEVTERRRRIYEDLCMALRIFISGHKGATVTSEHFHASHAAAWLWASDEVLSALNHLIALQRARADNPASIDEAVLKTAHTAVVLAMRRDVGFSQTSVKASSYEFVVFGDDAS